ncbi:hypothetical protein [Niallia taxi]|uniref:hypothetical protein n=1 Tax=Niallia taxi TaxID=2499688 RepID=UPI00300A161A
MTILNNDNKVYMLDYKNTCPVNQNGDVIDWTPALNKAVSDNNNCVIQLPLGDVPFITEPLPIQKYIRIEGYGSRFTTVRINADINWLIFRGNNPIGAPADSYLVNSGVGLEGVTITGLDSKLHTKNAVSFIYVGRAGVTDVIISRFSGNGMYLRSAQDMMINDCYFRYCGNLNMGTSCAFLDEYYKFEGATDQNNVNEIKFFGCTFEHNTGQLLRSLGINNNSNKFIGCKFEYTGAPGNPVPIELRNASRFIFSDCTYTHYDSTGMFSLESCWGIEISGETLNNNEPIYFARLTDSRAVNINVGGRKIGKIIKNGSTYNIVELLNDQEHLGRFYNYILQNYNEYEAINLRNIHYPDEGALIIDDSTGTDGCSIQITNMGPSKRVLLLSLNKARIDRDGITIWIRIFSSVIGIFKAAVYSENNLMVSGDINVSSGEDWYKFSIPQTALQNPVLFILTTPSNLGQSDSVTIKQLYYENKIYMNAPPTSGKWSTKDKVYKNTTENLGFEGWRCITSGDPGVWVTFGHLSNSRMVLTPLNGANNVTSFPIDFIRDGRNVTINGIVRNIKLETVFATLPPGYRPPRTRYFFCGCIDTNGNVLGQIRVEIGTNGNIRPVNMPPINTDRVYLDGISFVIY